MVMSSHTNDVGDHFNNKEMYVLKSCSTYRGGDLKFEKKAKTGWYSNLIKYLIWLDEYLISRSE